MRALVLEKARGPRVRDIELPTELGPDDVTIAMRALGVCDIDVDFYEHDDIGPVVVRTLMALGPDGAGVAIAVEFAAKGLPSVVKTQIVFE